ncbi:MAG: isochorismatase family protein [Burkholderiaceae bacterium]|nr:MAG: isochorismatase family protein [Burkholderiaceae bacterium]TAM04398.1 MAG: isochorismatase family protein [Pusillimonas sp.]
MNDHVAPTMDWRTVFPEEDRKIYEAARFGGQLEFGQNPAIMIIDVVDSFAGPKGQGIFDSINQYRTSCGEAGDAAIKVMANLLAIGRSLHVPIVYTKGSVVDKYYAGDSVKGTRPDEVERIYGAPIVAAIAPIDGEYVLEKTKASAFFGTPMASFLQRHRIDTLLICGTSTSGCVRASTIDAFSHGYQVFVLEDGVFDRSPMSNAVNLYEMNQKYASVINSSDAIAYLRKLKVAA